MIEFKCSDCGEQWGSEHREDCERRAEGFTRVDLYDCDDDTAVPYVFDLFYDVKQLGQLLQLYWQARGRVKNIEEMAREHGINLGDCAPWRGCDD